MLRPRSDSDWLAAAAALAARGRPLSRPNPAVGAILVKDGIVVGRGWTREGGRPHAEAEALAMAGDAARGATLYVTLEPCAHESERGPSCADLVSASGVAHVVIGVNDPDPRTAGKGIARITAAGIAARVFPSVESEASLAGYLMVKRQGRPHVTLKLAMSLDGCIAMADGTSQWITGEAARAHVHVERAKADAILVGGGTLRADEPRLDVRLPGLEPRSPARFALTSGQVPEGWSAIASPEAIGGMEGVQYLYVEGGAQTASAFLAADLVDRIALYRAPILIGDGLRALGNIGVASLGAAHGRWFLSQRRQFGSDTLEILERTR